MAIRTYGDTLIANATSVAYQVESGGQSQEETITLVLGGSFNSATCTLEVSAGNTSPFEWVADSAGAFTTTDIHNLKMVPGMYFRLVVSSSGSPQASINYSFRGDIKAVG